MYLHNILQGSGKGGRKVPPILTAISLTLKVVIVFHVSRACKPTCSVVMAPEVIWEPVSPCKYCSISLHQNVDHICPTLPFDRAATLWKEKQWWKHRFYVPWSPSQSSSPLLLFYIQKERDFSFVSPAERYLCVCMCEGESRRERIRLRRWLRQLKGPNR